jgi:ABC-type phosphate transport system substrate-binding protein
MIRSALRSVHGLASSLLRRWGVVCALWAIALGVVVVARASETTPAAFVVVVNGQNATTSMSREFLAHAFLKKVSHWDGGEVIRPVDQRADSSVRGAFSGDVLRRTVGAVRSYWQQRIFSGGELPPPELDSDEAVVRYVAKYPGAVGYVSPSAKLGDTKAIVVP